MSEQDRLRGIAANCERVAGKTSNRKTATALRDMGTEYKRQAARLDLGKRARD
jgi:hypothetical protein